MKKRMSTEEYLADPSHEIVQVNRHSVCVETACPAEGFMLALEEFCEMPVENRPYLVGKYTYVLSGRLYVRCMHDRPEKLEFGPRYAVWDYLGWGYLGGGGGYRGYDPDELRRLYYTHLRGLHCTLRPSVRYRTDELKYDHQFAECCDSCPEAPEVSSWNVMGCRYCALNRASLPD